MIKVQSAKDHRANRLLAALEPEDFADLEPHLEFVHLHQRQVLCETGDTMRHAYFPHDTVISLLAVMADGSSAEMSLCGREGVSGLVNASVSRKAFGCYVVQFPGTASRIDLDTMTAAITARPNLQRVLRHFTEATMARILQSVACNALHSVEARCCRFVLMLHSRIDHDALPITHEFLAERLGVQRSTVSSVMGKLQSRGLIKQGRGGIIVTDPSRLEDAACECYGRVRDVYERLLPYATHSR
ncbi:Crp/Fnr family transcriptional regulator [Microvirga sp. VF16]|uniref:Crp/Fnr family transcriptional regulator n=1 Tax=Microvirga sp. VF16 TaxID=2807101 RepID=UPI00193D151C|nr:Crp/Fnr family transcriptional regulator [Microvirga sp. VF16]QRM34118.1 Crp/Fnr family transcriptional regulator [Microvirga sp. VF16]